MRRLPALGLLTGLLLLPLAVSAETLGEMESRLDLRQSSDQGQATFVGKSARLTAWQQMENLKAGKGWGIVREKDKGGSAGWLAKPMHDGAVVASFPNSQDTAYVWLKPAGAATFLAHRTNGSRLEDGIATPYVSLRAQRYGIDSQYMPYVVLGTYDGNGRLALTRFADGSTETVAYDAEGNKVRETDRAGREMRYAYDALNRLVRTEWPNGDSESSTYDAVGQLVASTDARGRTTTYAYDAAGRQVAVTDAQGRVTSYTHDANGNVLTMTSPRGKVTRYEYDKVNRRTATTLPNGRVLTVSYDAMGRKTAETLPSGRMVRYGYDALGRLTSVTDHLNRVTRYTYDEAGNKLTQTDAKGLVTRWTYDALNRVTSRTLPDGTSETYTPDAATGGQ